MLPHRRRQPGVNAPDIRDPERKIGQYPLHSRQLTCKKLSHLSCPQLVCPLVKHLSMDLVKGPKHQGPPDTAGKTVCHIQHTYGVVGVCDLVKSYKRRFYILVALAELQHLTVSADAGLYPVGELVFPCPAV